MGRLVLKGTKNHLWWGRDSSRLHNLTIVSYMYDGRDARPCVSTTERYETFLVPRLYIPNHHPFPSVYCYFHKFILNLYYYMKNNRIFAFVKIFIKFILTNCLWKR